MINELRNTTLLQIINTQRNINSQSSDHDKKFYNETPSWLSNTVANSIKI